MNPRRDWRPAASLENLQLRAQILAGIRAFFSVRNVMEVETPLLSAAAATAPFLDSFVTRYEGPMAPQGQRLYLQTSPEFAMKRLLVGGSGPIYQICKAFRNGEAGAQHNPEFTMLEWYRPGFDHHALMDEVEALVDSVLGTGSIQRIQYRALFLNNVGLNPFEFSAEEARACLSRHGVDAPNMEGATLDDWLTLILTHIIEPSLASKAVFIHGFPASQAMLARLSDTEPPVAERFELYVNGIELANGFHELQDGIEQQRRFELELQQREQIGLPPMPMDDALVDALMHGLPDCAGVALGVDRLLMLAANENALARVLAFPVDRC